MKRFFIFLTLVFVLCFSFGCNGEKRIQSLGVWWWDTALTIDYLEFAKEEGVTEIYYCDSNFNNETREFIRQANARNIKVYWLAGEYQWLENADALYEKIEKFNQFQDFYSKTKFAGIHLDIEPHQHKDFDNRRLELIKNLINLSYNLKNSYPNISFDYDIPFWFDDEISYNEKTLPAYAHIINYSSRTFLMSYRDSAEKIYDVSKDEIEYAKKVNKQIFLGVETYSKEGDNVSFMEEGKIFMKNEIQKLRKMIPSNFGITIHQIKTWKEL